MDIKVSANFDSGNIEVVDLSNPENIQLKIRKDSHSDFLQWFHFRVQSQKNQKQVLNIINAGETSYAKGWENYRAYASYNRKDWFTVDTTFDGKTLTIKHTPAHETTYYAYYAPYSFERHLDLLSKAQENENCTLLDLGNTLDGRDFNMLMVGQASETKKKVWIIARQHPGETMAEWFMEGFILKLLDGHNAISRELLKKAVFYIVPNMNPDGSYRGNLRTNASGANLNREWQEPTLEKSPEVLFVKNKVKETGVDLFMDIHGDEALPYNFLVRCEGITSYNKELEDLENLFIKHYMTVNPDMQDTYGYEKDKFGEANLTLASNYMAETHKCLALTLEMPFKDNANIPDEKYGWSNHRSIRLGESALDVIHYMMDKI